MPLSTLKAARKKIVGSKQTQKALEKGLALKVYIARDAEPQITQPIVNLCKEKGVEVVYVETMTELGKICGIDVGSASAAILEE